MSEQQIENHHCPGCGAELKFVARYPWYFCNSCLKQAHDFYGRKLLFFNVSLSGGLGWAFADAPDKVMSDRVSCVQCLIKGRVVVVSEARFGGVVAQPVGSEPRPGDHAYKYTIHLNRNYDVDEMLQRMHSNKT